MKSYSPYHFLWESGGGGVTLLLSVPIFNFSPLPSSQRSSQVFVRPNANSRKIYIIIIIIIYKTKTRSNLNLDEVEPTRFSVGRWKGRYLVSSCPISSYRTFNIILVLQIVSNQLARFSSPLHWILY